MLAESLSSTASMWALIGSWFTPAFFFVLLNLMIGTILITSSFPNQKHQHQDSHANPLPQQLPPSPSALQILKSFIFNPYRSPQPTHDHSPEFHAYHIFAQHPQIARSPSLLERFKSLNLYNHFPTEPILSKLPTSTNSSVLHTTTTHPATIHFNFRNTHEFEKHNLNPPAVESEEEREEEHDVVGQISHIDELPQPERPHDQIYGHFQGAHVTRTKSNATPVPDEDDIVENSGPATIKEAQDTAAGLADDQVDAKADDFINKFKQQLKLQRLDSITE